MDLWEPVMLLANRQPLTDRQGQPRPFMATLVGGGVAQDQPTVQRSWQGYVGSVTIHQGRWELPVPGARYSWGLHAFLGKLASGFTPVPVFSGLTLLAIDRDGTVQLLHLLFYFLVVV